MTEKTTEELATENATLRAELVGLREAAEGISLVIVGDLPCIRGGAALEAALTSSATLGARIIAEAEERGRAEWAAEGQRNDRLLAEAECAALRAALATAERERDEALEGQRQARNELLTGLDAGQLRRLREANERARAAEIERDALRGQVAELRCLVAEAQRDARAAGIAKGAATAEDWRLSSAHVALWDAVMEIVEASHGDTANTSVARQRAVAKVEAAVERARVLACGPLATIVLLAEEARRSYACDPISVYDKRRDALHAALRGSAEIALRALRDREARALEEAAEVFEAQPVVAPYTTFTVGAWLRERARSKA